MGKFQPGCWFPKLDRIWNPLRKGTLGVERRQSSYTIRDEVIRNLARHARSSTCSSPRLYLRHSCNNSVATIINLYIMFCWESQSITHNIPQLEIHTASGTRQSRSASRRNEIISFHNVCDNTASNASHIQQISLSSQKKAVWFVPSSPPPLGCDYVLRVWLGDFSRRIFFLVFIVQFLVKKQ